MKGKDGLYLRGAALHSALASRCKALYYLRHPEQSAALNSASPEERALIEQVALDCGARLIRRAQFWQLCLKPVAGAIAGTSLMGFLTLLVRPQWLAIGLGLGLLFNAGMATFVFFENLEDL